MQKLLLWIWLLICQAELVRRIVGGSRTTAKPWLVLLKHPNAKCGGILYTGSLVITAAHCTNFNVHDWEAHLNRNNLNKQHYEENASIYFILDRVNHPSYNLVTNNYDVSVWWLDSSSDLRTPVDIAKPSDYNPNFPVSIAGWGAYQKMTFAEIKSLSPKLASSPVLLKANVFLANDLACRLQYPDNINSYTMFCTGDPKHRSSFCKGDSGGPVYREAYGRIKLLGVISFTHGCGQAGIYDVSIRVSHPMVRAFIDYYALHFSPRNLIRKPGLLVVKEFPPYLPSPYNFKL